MYRVIGGDQHEYGPIPAEQVRQWIAEGRLNAQSKVQPEGTTEWIAASEVPELAPLFGGNVPPPSQRPPPLPAQAAPGPMSGMAVWSLVLGILGFATLGIGIIITAPFGIILGVRSMSKISKSQGRLRGHGVALAGTVVSGTSLLLIPLIAILAGMLLPALAKAKVKAQSIQCSNNLKQLALAARLYASDHKEQFPAAADWCDALSPYTGNAIVFQCPAGRAGGRGQYAFNSNVAGASTAQVNPATVLFFEGIGGRNLSGDQTIIPPRPPHGNVYCVAFADGHVEQVTEGRLGGLRWNP